MIVIMTQKQIHKDAAKIGQKGPRPCSLSILCCSAHVRICQGFIPLKEQVFWSEQFSQLREVPSVAKHGFVLCTSIARLFCSSYGFVRQTLLHSIESY